MSRLFFQPQEPDYRGLWDWNPAQTFITAKNELESADLKRAESERLRKKDEIDAAVTNTMLPLKVREAEANIALTMARMGESGARAQYLANSEGKELSDRKKKYNALNDPDALSKGNSLIGTPFSTSAPTETTVPVDTGFENINSSGGFDLTQLDEEESPFLTQFAGELPNPATSLEPNNYDISRTPGEMSADMNGGAMQLPQVSEKDAAEIKNMARGSGAQADMARSVDLRGSKSPLDELVSRNPLDDFNDTLAENSGAFASTKKVVKEPAPPSLGQQISAFNNWSSSAKRKISELSGDPAAQVYALKAFNHETNRFLGQLGSSYDSDEVDFITKNPSRADAYAEYRGAGRTFEESRALTGMSPNHAKGILSVLNEGRLPDGTSVIADSLEEAKMIYTNAIRQDMKPTKEENVAEQISKWQAVRDKTLDANGEVIPERLAEYEAANAKIDQFTGKPQGISSYADGISRLSDKQNKLNLAFSNGVDYGATLKDEIPQAIVKLNEDKVRLAVDKAPFFNPESPSDREKLQKWLSDETTKNLPYNTLVDGVAATLEPTGKSNVYNRWSPTEKTWVVYDFNKKEPPPAAPAATTSASTDGMLQEEEDAQSKRRGDVVNWVKSLSDLPSQAQDYLMRRDIEQVSELEKVVAKIDEELAKNQTFEKPLISTGKTEAQRLNRPLTKEERNQLIKDRNFYQSRLNNLIKTTTPPTEKIIPVDTKRL
jgi:hypothetical protein